MTGFALPPDVTSDKQRLADGWAYVFRHRRLGPLGRRLLQDLPNGQSQAHCEVAGDPADPMTAERARIFQPIGLARHGHLPGSRANPDRVAGAIQCPARRHQRGPLQTASGKAPAAGTQLTIHNPMMPDGQNARLRSLRVGSVA